MVKEVTHLEREPESLLTELVDRVGQIQVILQSVQESVQQLLKQQRDVVTTEMLWEELYPALEQLFLAQLEILLADAHTNQHSGNADRQQATPAAAPTTQQQVLFDIGDS